MTLATEIGLAIIVSAYPAGQLIKAVREFRRQQASGRFFQARQASENEIAYRSQLAALANLAGGSAACADYPPAAKDSEE